MSFQQIGQNGDAPDGIKVIHNRVYFYARVTSQTALEVNAALREAERNVIWNGINYEAKQHIWLHINSDGGDFFSSFAIVDTILSLTIPVYTMVEGISASGGSLMALSGSKRYMTRHSFIMIHQLSVLFGGDHEDFKDNMKFQKSAMKNMVAFYASRTKLSKKEIREKLKRDWWLNAGAALKYGFVHEVKK